MGWRLLDKRSQKQAIPNQTQTEDFTEVDMIVMRTSAQVQQSADEHYERATGAMMMAKTTSVKMNVRVHTGGICSVCPL
jgi:hypothetical protein